MSWRRRLVMHRGLWLMSLPFLMSCTTPEAFVFPGPSSSRVFGAGWELPRAGVPSQYHQSCSTPAGAAVCNAPAPSSTGEILIPATGRAVRAGATAVRVVEAVQGYIHLERLLTEAEVGEVEDILKDCAKQAEADVNQAAQKRDDIGRFENGQFPNENECNRVVRFDGDEAVTLARELGGLKHTAAFDCVKGRLSQRFPGNFSSDRSEDRLSQAGFRAAFHAECDPHTVRL